MKCQQRSTARDLASRIHRKSRIFLGENAGLAYGTGTVRHDSLYSSGVSAGDGYTNQRRGFGLVWDGWSISKKAFTSPYLATIALTSPRAVCRNLMSPFDPLREPYIHRSPKGSVAGLPGMYGTYGARVAARMCEYQYHTIAGAVPWKLPYLPRELPGQTYCCSHQ